MQKMLLAAGAVGVLGLVLSTVTAEPPPAEVNIKDALKYGKYWYGPKISKKDLAGRVVMVEDWGYN